MYCLVVCSGRAGVTLRLESAHLVVGKGWVGLGVIGGVWVSNALLGLVVWGGG